MTTGFLFCGRFPSGGSRKVFNDPFPQSIDTFQRHAVDRNDFNVIVFSHKVTNDGVYQCCLARSGSTGYKSMLVVWVSWSMNVPSINEVRNWSRDVHSTSRPAIEEEVLLQVERSKARTRA